MFFFFQAEDGIRDLVRSRGLGDVYKRQVFYGRDILQPVQARQRRKPRDGEISVYGSEHAQACLLYTSDAADERSSVDLGGRRIIKKKKKCNDGSYRGHKEHNTHKREP